MDYSKLEILGLRGFSIKQSLEFGIPNGNLGSGLTILVGPNNSGKSTITEALNAFTTNTPPSFPEGKRNIQAGRRIDIRLTNTATQSISLKTIAAGGSESKFDEAGGIQLATVKPFIVPSRRMFSPAFNKDTRTRDVHIQTYGLPAQRGQGFNEFSRRLFQIQTNPIPFNDVLSKVLDNPPSWNIDQSNDGSYYLKFIYGSAEHSSDGAGEGLLSVFIVVDALYDSNPGDLIVIDEPELSIHPSLQKKLMNLLAEYAKDRQIIISTHSPYFISWESLVNGGKIARVVKDPDTCRVNQLSQPVVHQIGASLNGINNPHVFGLTSAEVFFLNEQVILVEGQEDVVVYGKILKQLGIELKGDFYGWGVGGADNMKNIAAILRDLGFKKVCGVLDLNKAALIPQLQMDFPTYKFVAIPADDVRDKAITAAKPAVVGLTETNGTLKAPFIGDITALFNDINTFFTPPPAA
jgi:predicted ATPase